MSSAMLQIVVRLSVTLEQMSVNLGRITSTVHLSTSPAEVTLALKRHTGETDVLNSSFQNTLQAHNQDLKQHQAQLRTTVQGRRFLSAHQMYTLALGRFTSLATREFKNLDVLGEQLSLAQEVWYTLWGFITTLWEWQAAWTPHCLFLLDDHNYFSEELLYTLAGWNDWLLAFVQHRTETRKVLEGDVALSYRSLLAVTLPTRMKWKREMLSLAEPIIMYLAYTCMGSHSRSDVMLGLLPLGCLENLCLLICELTPLKIPATQPVIQQPVGQRKSSTACTLALILAKDLHYHTTCGPSSSSLPQELASAAVLEVVKIAIHNHALECLDSEEGHSTYALLLRTVKLLLFLREEAPDAPRSSQHSRAALQPTQLRGRSPIRNNSSGSSSSNNNQFKGEMQLLSDIAAVAARHPRHLDGCTSIMQSVLRVWTEFSPYQQTLTCLPIILRHSATHLQRAISEGRSRCVNEARGRTSGSGSISAVTPPLLSSGKLLNLQELMLQTLGASITFVNISGSETQQQGSQRQQQQQQQQRLSTQVGRPLQTLTTFFSMPGSLVLLECAMRQQSTEILAELVHGAFNSASQNLLRDLNSTTPTTSVTRFRPHSSIFATTIKLLRLHFTTSQLQAPGQGSHCLAVESLHAWLQLLLLRLIYLHASENAVGGVTPHELKNGSKQSQHSSTTTSSDSNSGCCGSTRSLTESELLLHRTRKTRPFAAVLVMGLLCVEQKRCEQERVKASPNAVGLEGDPSWAEELSCTDAELGKFAAAQQLLSRGGTSLGEVERLQAAAWEGFAVQHLDGRLLPSCCSLACTNLQGTSEATLPTLLCSGCRRARYCDVGCQRAAWLDGGHRYVCGKSM